MCLQNARDCKFWPSSYYTYLSQYNFTSKWINSENAFLGWNLHWENCKSYFFVNVACLHSHLVALYRNFQSAHIHHFSWYLWSKKTIILFDVNLSLEPIHSSSKCYYLQYFILKFFLLPQTSISTEWKFPRISSSRSHATISSCTTMLIFWFLFYPSWNNRANSPTIKPLSCTCKFWQHRDH